MSHSTTATSTYALAKYSKSYPAGPQPNPDSSTSDWQHFTNPSIRLVLDVKKGVELESVRLRILWSMDPDLLTLSCLPQRPTQKRQAQDLPLKAVYRDTVVGIRYLHPIDNNSSPITFLSSIAVLEFINAISTVCPCKANPSATPIPKTMNPPLNSINNPSLSQSQHHGPATYAPSIIAPPASTSTVIQHPRRDLFSSSQSLAYQTSSHPNVYSSSPLRTENSDFLPSSSASRLPFQQPALYTPAIDSIGPSIKPSQLPAHPRVQNLQQQPALPSSSPPTSSAKSDCNCNGLSMPPSTASGDAPVDSGSAILASLGESTSLYDLPPATLEQLVGDVVREEGFTKLLENISSMWRVKSFVGI
ncbi:hypothetical protein D9615_004626 [Tricholomella constricta]|uniref:Uncharacterized protein n=1 Tax=Tricholomella constricta TaxID=117010 RepID=A0A8H5HBH3_9AGAR|nr:hypothetical protein D9615_004626 [Tricholomella constricta]